MLQTNLKAIINDVLETNLKAIINDVLETNPKDIINDVLETNPKASAAAFNHFFVSIGESLVEAFVGGEAFVFERILAIRFQKLNHHML